jgi:hypothetical protein
MARQIEAVGHVAPSLASADEWDRAQLRELTLDERLRIAEMLRERAYGPDRPDVRESELRG